LFFGGSDFGQKYPFTRDIHKVKGLLLKNIENQTKTHLNEVKNQKLSHPQHTKVMILTFVTKVYYTIH